ncbi:MAG: hypothetical protein ACR2H3_13925, partial [Acidimicrobiales bacterium]
MPLPQPDDMVHVINSFYERQADGTWLAWIEPLGGDEPRQRLFVAHGTYADQARDGLAAMSTTFLGTERLLPQPRCDHP